MKKNLAVLLLFSLAINMFCVNISFAEQNIKPLASTEQLKILAEKDKRERNIGGILEVVGGTGFIIWGISIYNQSHGPESIIMAYPIILFTVGGAWNCLLGIKDIFIYKTETEKKYIYMLKLNIEEREQYAHDALLNKDILSLRYSMEAYSQMIANSIVWIEGKVATTESDILRNILTFVPPHYIKVIEGSFVYLKPQKSDPVGKVYVNEEYRFKETRQNKEGLWYGIKINPDHVITKGN